MSDNPLADWLRDSEPGPLDDEPSPRRHARVPVLIAVVSGLWLGLVVAAWQALGAPTAEPVGAAPPETTTVEPPVPVAPPATRADDRHVAARAVLAVRTELEAPPGNGLRRYADLVVTEAVQRVGTGYVVTVLVHLLEGDEDRWTSTRPARYGVALDVVGREVVPADIWALPAPRQAAPTDDWDPVPDPRLLEAAQAALRRAGYEHLEEITLAVRPGLSDVLRATVTAVAPGEGAPADHTVWLDGAAAAVLGWSPER